MRRTFVKIIRCKILNSHDWKPVRIDGDDARVCRLCGKRDFDPPGAKRDEVLREAGLGLFDRGGGGAGGG